MDIIAKMANYASKSSRHLDRRKNFQKKMINIVVCRFCRRDCFCVFIYYW